MNKIVGSYGEAAFLIDEPQDDLIGQSEETSSWSW